MGRREVAKRVALEANVSAVEAARIAELVLDGIVDAIVTEGGIELRNFGVFDVKMRKATTARNLRTGERIAVQAKPRVRFIAGKELQARLNRPAGAGDVLETATIKG